MGHLDYSMSNDEVKTSLLNYRHIYFQSNTLSDNTNLYQSKFLINPSEKFSKSSLITPSAKTTSYHLSKGNDNKYNNKKSNNNNQFVPMNLITNTGLDLSHSIVKPTFETYLNNDSLIHYHHYNHNNNLFISSPCSSNSPSIDVENDVNDDCADRIMSPVSIPSHLQKPLLNDTRNTSQSAFTNMELSAGSIPTGFPLNYQQLYANNAALYGAPVMFSGAIHAAHASYMAGLPLHATLSPNETYLKAIQAAACGVYSPTALAPPPPPPSTSSSAASVNPALTPAKPTALHNPTGASMMALAPSSQSVGISKSPHQAQQHQYSPSITNNRTEIEQHQQQKKKDYHLTPLNSQTSLRTNATTNNTTGTYLNDKVNERLTGAGATIDSHFKVPNGKEGSLKHRILRPPSNNDVPAEQTKTPVMRTYSSSTNFKKGNYIELANGTLRRVEDMRTEDFIQCAERSPHHQLAESTVVKVNTSLPTTAVITFSYDRNRSKVDMEVSMEHPFFVYGQGWASCNPEMSMKMFGLKCQRLQVGDICISLRKREQTKQPTSSATHTSQSSSLATFNEPLGYQTRHTATVSSPSAVNLKATTTLPALNTATEIPSYTAALNAHSFPIAVPQTPSAVHHLQQQQQQLQHHQVQQQAYAEMAKIMSSYAYAKGLPQLPHEQLKEVIIDANMMQNLSPKLMTTYYQNQIFQLAQQEHLRHHDFKNSQQRVLNPLYAVTSINPSLSPQSTDLENNHMQQQPPPQTQPLDVTMSRKRRWSAPENMFDDDESETQPPRKGPSPSTART